ncbi:unnamed protein product [Polarella glacialis]|uniref:Uncharacterized protein n=1 Tax=Polarella glacialis TaxID=89957 RepID=A0A813HYS9_POLGL|nr:unnamed protein product [Polarella glacialis]
MPVEPIDKLPRSNEWWKHPPWTIHHYGIRAGNKGFVELEGEEKTPWDILTEMNEDWWQTAIYERRCGSDNLLGTSIKYIDPEKACDGYPPDTPDHRAEPASKQSRRSSGADLLEVETAGCSAYCTGCKGCKGPEWTDAAAEITSKLSSNTRTSNTSRTRPTAAPKTRPIPVQEANKKDSSKVVPVPTSWPQSRWAPLEPNQTMLDIALRTNWRDFADAESSITGRTPRTEQTMCEGTTGTFKIMKSDLDAKTHTIKLSNADGEEICQTTISEHDDHLEIGKYIHDEMERRWGTLTARDKKTDLVEHEMWNWWNVASTARTLTQRKWFFPVFNLIWESPQYRKWTLQGDSHIAAPGSEDE